MITGTITLNTVDLAEACDAVYLLAEEELDPDATTLYEASLDDGATWETITPGELNTLAHSGSSLKVRLTMELPDESEDEGVVRYFVAYATQEA